MKVGSSANLNQIYKNDIKNKNTTQTEETKETAAVGKVETIKAQLENKEYDINIQGTAEKMADKLL